MVPNPGLLDGQAERSERAAELEARFGRLEPWAVIEQALAEGFDGGVAAVSSFGADSAVLLDIISKVDRTLPVLFLDTGKHFDETLGYRDALVADLAAPPGGIDFEAAKALGIKAIWARGLGSRAPVTVGASQWSGIRTRIEAIMGKTA